MSLLEEKFKEQKKSFDNKEPEKDHLARFILKLEADQKKLHKSSFPTLFLKIAASVVILITAGYLAMNFVLSNKSVGSNQAQLISYSPELTDVMAYYDQASVEKMRQIDALITDNEEAKQVKQTAYNSLEDLDVRLAAIEKEYMKNPDNSALKAALINNKRKKVEVMDRIIMQIDFANTQLY